MKKERLIKLAILVLIISSGVFGQAYGSKQYQKSGFSISLPDGWVEIPRDIIDVFEKEIFVPNVPKQHYDYGFQLEASQHWFEYPYILVQIKDTGRIPERQLKKIKECPIQKAFDKHEKALGPLVSGFQASSKMYYDKHAKTLWLRAEMDVVNNIGPIVSLIGMVLTEEGLIVVSGRSLKDDYANYEPIFQSVIASVTPELWLAYKPRWSDALPPAVRAIDWKEVVVYAIVGAILALLSSFRRKKKK